MMQRLKMWSAVRCGLSVEPRLSTINTYICHIIWSGLVWSGLVGLWFSFEQFRAIEAVWNNQSYKQMDGWMDEMGLLSLNSVAIRAPLMRC